MTFNHRLHGHHWNSFIERHGRFFDDDDDEEEEDRRKDIFAMNWNQIEEHNQLHSNGGKSYKLGMNQFSDLPHSQFLEFMTCMKPSHHFMHVAKPSQPNFTPSDDISNSIDWRQQGLVTDVKDQGRTGACWSFAATGALEAHNARKSGQLVSLSEQNLIDGTNGPPYGNCGTRGGLARLAFTYVKDNGGINSEDAYPFEEADGVCHYDQSDVAGTCNGFVHLPPGDEDALQQAVAQMGPVAVAVDASHPSFQHYAGGVYNEPAASNTDHNHAVLVVGYGSTDSGQDYWIVKNSWGTTWGDRGYILMSRNRDNQCAIATEATYPLVG